MCLLFGRMCRRNLAGHQTRPRTTSRNGPACTLNLRLAPRAGLLFFVVRGHYRQVRTAPLWGGGGWGSDLLHHLADSLHGAVGLVELDGVAAALGDLQRAGSGARG